jgi:hypothetical protein
MLPSRNPSGGGSRWCDGAHTGGAGHAATDGPAAPAPNSVISDELVPTVLSILMRLVTFAHGALCSVLTDLLARSGEASSRLASEVDGTRAHAKLAQRLCEAAAAAELMVDFVAELRTTLELLKHPPPGGDTKRALTIATGTLRRVATFMDGLSDKWLKVVPTLSTCLLLLLHIPDDNSALDAAAWSRLADELAMQDEEAAAAAAGEELLAEEKEKAAAAKKQAEKGKGKGKEKGNGSSPSGKARADANAAAAAKQQASSRAAAEAAEREKRQIEAAREREKREYDAALAARAEQLQRECEDAAGAGVEERRPMAHEKPPPPAPRKVPLPKPRPALMAPPDAAIKPAPPQAAGGSNGPSAAAAPKSDAAHATATRECCICLNDVPLPKMLALVRCGHRCVCTNCVDAVLASRKCPRGPSAGQRWNSRWLCTTRSSKQHHMRAM